MLLKRTLRYLAVAEAVTLLVLVLVAVPLKYLAGYPTVTTVMGPIHGGMFVLFIGVVALSLAARLIGWAGALRLVIGAMIPFGGVINERWLRSHLAQVT